MKFPTAPINEPLVNEKGFITQQWQSFFDDASSFINNTFYIDEKNNKFFINMNGNLKEVSLL